MLGKTKSSFNSPQHVHFLRLISHETTLNIMEKGKKRINQGQKKDRSKKTKVSAAGSSKTTREQTLGFESEKSIIQVQGDSDWEGNEEAPIPLEDPMINFSPSSPKSAQITELGPQKDALERIIKQNKAIWSATLKINKKLDNLTGVQKKMIREDSLGKNFWEIAARKICSLLAKETMYPPPEEFKKSLEEYLDQKSPCYIQDIGKHRWETKFYSELITMCYGKMRSYRSDFSKRVRQSIFEILEVTPINTNASASNIADWKRSSEVAAAYQSLWESGDKQNLSTIDQILTKAFPKEISFTSYYVAYTLAVSTTLLDPKGKNIKLNDETLKKRIGLFMSRLEANQVPIPSDLSLEEQYEEIGRAHV